MSLFSCKNMQPCIDPVIPSIVTPLGTVLLQVSVGGKQYNGVEPSLCCSTVDEGRIYLWPCDEFELELLICRPVLTSYPTIVVQGCLAGMWRLRAKHDLSDIVFSAVWASDKKWSEGGPDGGEWLYAKTWLGDGVTVTIGTEDEKALSRRSARDQWLPSRLEGYFQNQFFDDEVHTALLSAGLPVPLPALAAGEKCQVHFTVAWSEESSEQAHTWYAVHCAPSDILRGGKCAD